MTQPHHYVEYLRSGKPIRLLPACTITEASQTPPALAQSTMAFTLALESGERFVLPQDLPWDDACWWRNIHASAEAMAATGCFHLPFPSVVVQHEGTVVVMREEAEGCIAAQAIYTADDKAVTLCGIVVRIVAVPRSDDPERVVFEFRPCINYPHHPYEDQQAVNNLVRALGRLTLSLIVLLHARGVETEAVPAPERLNKARLKKKKPAIRPHTIIRLRPLAGSGSGIAAGNHDDHERDPDAEHRSDAERSCRRSPRIHLRRGHVGRRGKDRHKAYVRPCIVGMRSQIGRAPMAESRTYIVPDIAKLDLSPGNENQHLGDKSA